MRLMCLTRIFDKEKGKRVTKPGGYPGEFVVEVAGLMRRLQSDEGEMGPSGSYL